MSVSDKFKPGDIVRVSVPMTLPSYYEHWATPWRRIVYKLDGEVVKLIKPQGNYSGWRFDFIDDHSDHIIWDDSSWQYVDEAWLTKTELKSRQGYLFL